MALPKRAFLFLITIHESPILLMDGSHMWSKSWHQSANQNTWEIM
jgi:hypothetical protein